MLTDFYDFPVSIEGKPTKKQISTTLYLQRFLDMNRKFIVILNGCMVKSELANLTHDLTCACKQSKARPGHSV